MNKTEALQRIEELQKFVQDLDKPKLVRVYVKENAETITRTGLSLSFTSEMEPLKGKVFDASHSYGKDSVHIEDYWQTFHPDWLVFVEGSFEDLEERS